MRKTTGSIDASTGALPGRRAQPPALPVLLGEEFYQEHGNPCHIIHTLLELEHPSTSDLLRRCLELSTLTKNWYGDGGSEAKAALLHQFNREQREARQSGFYFRSAPLISGENLEPAFEYGIDRIRERTAIGRKTLMLDGTPKVKTCLESIPAEVAAGDGVENYPPLAALAFAVAALDYFPYSDPTKMYAESTRGYNPLTW